MMHLAMPLIFSSPTEISKNVSWRHEPRRRFVETRTKAPKSAKMFRGDTNQGAHQPKSAKMFRGDTNQGAAFAVVARFENRTLQK